jgi:hypothetical protein
MLSDIIKSKNAPDRHHSPALVVPTIFVDRGPNSDILIERRGHPVWPIRDADDWRAVSRLCQLRSIHIQEVKGQPGETKRQKGAVTGLGCAKIQEVARLYAHLTARQFQGATDASVVLDLPRSAVVVTTFEYLNAKLLHALYSDTSARSSAGLICASGVEELRRQVLVRSILARPRLMEETTPWTAIFPTANVGTLAEAHYQIFDASSSPQHVRAALSARSGLLAIATHCDGIDAFLGRSLTFCALDVGATSNDKNRAPSCWLNGYCHRHGVSVPEFRRLGVSIAPADVSAGILLLDVCFGTLASDAPIDSKWGLGRHFIENLEIGAIATTWELTLLDVRKLEKLSADLRSGMTLGRAVARFNRSPMARRTATRLAIFGDPRTRVAGRPPIAARTWWNICHEVTSRPKARLSAELRELGFSRAYLEHAVAALSPQLGASSPHRAGQIKRQLEAAQNALQCLKRHELSQWRPQSSTPDVACAEQLRRALILDAYVRRPMDDWIQFAQPKEWTEFLCRVCGAPAKAGVFALRVPGVSRRRVVFCPRCGITEDMPEHVQITLQFDRSNHACAVAGTLPDREWTGALIVRTRIDAHDRMWMWPAQADGKPSPKMQLPELLPAGPLKLAVIIIHCGWVAWSAQDIHASGRDTLDEAPLAEKLSPNLISVATRQTAS